MKLRLTRPAARQLASVLRTIAEHNPHAAETVRDRLRSIMHVLTDHPYAGRITARPRVRRIVVLPYPYAITYTVTDGEVVILGVRHTSRRPVD